MSKPDEIFFTTVGCMDGRVQEVVAEFGQKKFDARFPDTITEAGLVGQLARLQLPSQSDGGQAKEESDQGLLDSIKNKLAISLEKHHSRGIIVHGHQECAASDAVEDEKHKEDIRKSVKVIKSIINSSVPVVGVFVKRSINDSRVWEIEEL